MTSESPDGVFPKGQAITPMTKVASVMQADDLACQLLKLEQQLVAYEKLHTTELAELWHTLNKCKQTIADSVSSDDSACPVEPGDSDAETDVLGTAITNQSSPIVIAHKTRTVRF
jgi:hypothetical protein